MNKIVAFLYFGSILNFQIAAFAGEGTSEYPHTCKEAFWNSPAESHQGIFVGDLSIECSVQIEPESKFDVLKLRKKVIDRIEAESTVNIRPTFISLNLDSVLNWDVSHDLKEDGDFVRIRENIELSTPNSNHLRYETHSTAISATGTASYLESVEFTMVIQRDSNGVSALFRNSVKVRRPWYAPDFIFAPICRNTCLSKLNRVKDKFIPWLIEALKDSYKSSLTE